jgi:tetratricopeptide (TPR) repeat protein
MQRRFAQRGLFDRVTFLDAVDGMETGTGGDAWAKSARGCFATHLNVMRMLVSDPEYAETGAIVFEDDALIHREFAERSEAAIANLPSGADHCLFGFMLAPPNPDLVWAGVDPGRHNLVGIEADCMWGSHSYWMAPARARRALDEYGDIPFDEMPLGTERFTVPRSGFAAWPALALQEAADSEIRPNAELDECHRRGQERWPLADYTGAADDESHLGFHGRPQPTIGLCMIVKDEAEVIERCLDSVEGLIDTWTICDTGSDDGTPDLIESRLAGLPGTLHHRPWRDFGQNRTELLELARGTADYLLLVDADMTIGWRGPLPELEADAYELRHEGDLGYWIPRLIRGDCDWHYVGATHEYLALDDEFTREPLRSLVIEHHGDGGSRDDKYERDRALLEAELDRDPDNDRATFYLAQTLRDMGLTEEAIKLYRRRVELGGWDEEVFYAAFQVAELTAEEKPLDSIPLFLEALELRPSRAEPLHQAAYACRRLGMWESAYTFARRAIEIPEPDDILFVSTTTYAWGSLFEFALAAHETIRHTEAIEAYEELLGGRELPQGIQGAARENLRRIRNISGRGDTANRYSEPSLAELCPSARIAEIKLDVEPAWPQFNPSIARDGDGFRMIVRTSNYHLDRGVYTMLDGTDEVRTINYLATLDSELQLLDVEPLVDKEHDLEWHDFPVRGWEDLRLFELGGEWYATATSRELSAEGVCRTVLLSLDEARIGSARILPGPDPHRHEKNWMPHVAGGELMFVYSCGPTVVTRVDPARGDPEPFAENEAPEAAESFRGGSQGVAVEGGVLFCIHEAFDLAGPRRYLHRWVLLDPSWRLIGASPRFHFADHDVEICAGLARRGDELIASFGVGDRAAALAVMAESEVLASLEAADSLRDET